MKGSIAALLLGSITGGFITGKWHEIAVIIITQCYALLMMWYLGYLREKE